MISIKNTETDFVIELDLGNVCNYKCNYCFPGANEGTVLWPDINKIEAALLNYIKTKKIIAFAGIAHPDNFFNLLYKYKLKLIKKIYFPDHYIYSKKEILKIINLSKIQSAKILTTSKDYTKIPNDLKKYITVIQINVNFEKRLFLKFINKKIEFNV